MLRFLLPTCIIVSVIGRGKGIVTLVLLIALLSQAYFLYCITLFSKDKVQVSYRIFRFDIIKTCSTVVRFHAGLDLLGESTH